MQTLRHKARQYWALAVDTLLPPRCVVTGDPVERQGMISPQAWLALDFIADPFCAKCGLPFEFEVDPGSHCAECLDHPPSFEAARAALKYNEASRDVILSFKHADKTHIVPTFVPWLMRAGGQMIARSDVILPVPLHYWRMLARRYNQSALIAEVLGKETGHPVLLDGLRRVRATPSQGHLTIKERAKNVRRAFALNPRYAEEIKGKTVLLVDDVYTTGATAKECTKTLLKGGARAVHVLTLARVVRGGV